MTTFRFVMIGNQTGMEIDGVLVDDSKPEQHASAIRQLLLSDNPDDVLITLDGKVHSGKAFKQRRQAIVRIISNWDSGDN